LISAECTAHFILLRFCGAAEQEQSLIQSGVSSFTANTFVGGIIGLAVRRAAAPYSRMASRYPGSMSSPESGVGGTSGGRGRHAPAGGSVGHAQLEHIKNVRDAHR